MAQPRRELDLAQEALGPERLADLGLEHLDRDVAVVLEVVGEKHRRHAAFPEHAVERIPIGEGKAQPGQQIRLQRARLVMGDATITQLGVG